jgi:hypothetical protein
MGCQSAVSFLVLIHGSASSFFNPSRGLRQRCPMSPFLFHPVVEGLHRAIKECKREGTIRGIKVGKSLFPSHLLFVDDVILFGMGTVREAKNTRRF